VVWRAVREWFAEHFAPVRRAIRERGLLRALPVSLAFGAAWLVAGVLGALPAAEDTVHDLVQYRATDLTDGKAWRLLLSIFGAYHLTHAAWALLNVVLVVAPLEARVRSPYTLLILWAGHLLPSLGAYAVLSTIGPERLLDTPDYGSSAALMAATAALAVVRRSRVIAVLLLVGLAGDAVFSDRLTSGEHLTAAAVGAALGAVAVFLLRRQRTEVAHE
jgi:hypothetical protein